MSALFTATVATAALALYCFLPVASTGEDRNEAGLYVVILTDTESSPEKLRDRYPEITGSWPDVAGFNLLRAGRPVELTREMLSRDKFLAKLAGFYGETEVRRSFEDRFIPVVTNLLLREGDVLRTWRKSGGRILLEDGSFFLIRSNSRARVSTLSLKDSPSDSRAKIELLEGSLWSRIERSVKGRFEIQTPSASTIIRGTDFRLKVESADATRLEVLEGTVEIKAGEKTVSVPASQGVFYQSGESAGLEALPPAPAELLAPQPEQVVRAEQFDQTFHWSPVPEAQAYRVEISRDGRFFDLVEERWAGPEPTVRIRDLEPGTYFWRVSAISRSGFEGSSVGDSYFVFVRTRP